MSDYVPFLREMETLDQVMTFDSDMEISFEILNDDFLELKQTFDEKFSDINLNLKNLQILLKNNNIADDQMEPNQSMDDFEVFDEVNDSETFEQFQRNKDDRVMYMSTNSNKMLQEKSNIIIKEIGLIFQKQRINIDVREIVKFVNKTFKIERGVDAQTQTEDYNDAGLTEY